MPRVPRFGRDFDSHRLRRLDDLTLGPHDLNVRTGSTPAVAPAGRLEVHTTRLSAESLYSETATVLGEKPVLPPLAAGGGKLRRLDQPVTAWAQREATNLPFLYPGVCFTPQDFHDFQVHKKSPTLLAAVAEIEAKIPNLRGVDASTAPLTPLAALLLECIQVVEKRDPFSSTRSGDVYDLIGNGLVSRGLAHFGQLFSTHNVFSQFDLQKLGPMGEGLLQSLREVVPAQRGLQAVLHRAELPIEPAYTDTPITREEVEAIRKVQPELLDQLVAEAPIPATLAPLEAVKALLPKDAFAGAHCVAVQHLLATNVTMFDAMVDRGLDPESTEIIGIPYSTNFVCEHALRQRGFDVMTPDVMDPSQVTDAYERTIGPALERALQKSKRDGKPVLLIDDGGKLSSYVAKHFSPQDALRFHVVEQTTRGLTELQSLDAIPMPAVNVAKSPLKQLEMPHIGEQVVRNVEDLCSSIGMGGVTAEPSLVMGFGPIGEGVANALRAKGSKVTVWDVDPDVRARARAAGFDCPEDRGEALRGKAVVVGASGHRSITREDLALLSNECVVASASSRDIEVDLTANHDQRVEVVPLLAAGRGDRRFTTRVWRFQDRDVVMLRNGFPINFDGDFETGTNDDIAPTRAAMMLGAAQALREKRPGLWDAAVEPQRQVAQAIGRELP
ncbi:MAG: hypothetical protein IPJ65_44225 [Archangiaceae bacterium]|nr:hypothetical protein [Archangiaceae bacterium]